MSGTAETPTARVVSVCEKRGAAAWKLAARRVPKHIRAREYLLVCPDSQLSDFRAITPASWTIRPDSDFLGGRDKAFFEQFAVYKEGIGWYLQQIIKLQAVADPALADNDVALIWDADTVPLRRLNFPDKDGRLLHFIGAEDHQPYFDTMASLLGLQRQVNYSFVAQCFATKAGWARELVNAIEKASGKEFPLAIFSQLRGIPKGGEFSEYETLGNFAMSRHAGEMRRTDAPWIRDVGCAARPKCGGAWCTVVLHLLSKRYCYASFERWHRATPIGALGILRKALLGPVAAAR